MSYIKLLLRILFIFYQACLDVYELIIISFFTKLDVSMLEMKIRHRAHILEKFLQNPGQKNRPSAHSRKMFKSLNFLINVYSQRDVKLSNDIIWAKKLQKEFQNFNSVNWRCFQIGTFAHKIQGIYEIQQPNSTNSQIAEINLLEFLRGRRSIRNWKSKQLTKEQIRLLIEAAIWAPSSCNRQTTKFIVIQNKKKISIVASISRGGRTFFYNAPTLILVVNDARLYQFPEERHTPYQDGAAAIQNMLLMAHRMGLGACWGSFCSDSGQIRDEKKLRRILHLPRHFKISGLVAIGLPDINVCPVPRMDIENYITWN